MLNPVHIILILFVVVMVAILINLMTKENKNLTVHLSSGRNLSGMGVGEKQLTLKRGQFPIKVTLKGHGRCAVKITSNFDATTEIHFCSPVIHHFTNQNVSHMIPLLVFTPLYGEDIVAELEYV